MPRCLTVKLFFWAILSCAAIIVHAQELNCKVTVNAEKIVGKDKASIANLEQNISEILSTTAWTSEKIKEQGKISCSFVLTLDARTDENTYQATLQVQADRPVFNSSYSTPILNHKDKEVIFTFLPNEALQYTAGGKNNEVVAIIAYYAYLIIGIDADSFANMGGSKALKNAQDIVLRQGNIGQGGWSAAERKINRYWIIEDLLSYKTLRETIFDYHRKGLDRMVTEPRDAIQTVLASIENLKKVNQKSTDVAAMHLFFDAKASEVVQSASVLSAPEKKKLYALLAKIDPGHLGIYKALE